MNDALQNSGPPRWADRLLERFCRPDYLEEIQGDLHESFYWRQEEKGKGYATRKFILETLLSFRFSNLKILNKMNQKLTLFKSHLKTGYRFMIRQKFYSLVNILGLSVGIVFSWFAYLYTTDQYSYNSFMDREEELHILKVSVKYGDNTITFPGISHWFSEKIKAEIPEVVEMVRLQSQEISIRHRDSFLREKVIQADASLVDMLNLKFKEGNAENFSGPNKIIISASMAEKLGFSAEAVNRTINLQDSAILPFKVVGVFHDIPENSSFKAHLITTYEHYLKNNPQEQEQEDQESDSYGISTFVRLNPETASADIAGKIHQLYGVDKFSFDLLPVKDLHLKGGHVSSNGLQPKGDEQLIWLIVIVGLLCLVISIINYANFSISLYLNRTREIATRKIIGSGKNGIFYQLMTESFLTTLLAAVVAVLLFYLIAPFFSLLVEKEFTLAALFTYRALAGMLGIIVLVALLSGLYPSLQLSQFSILSSVKGIRKSTKGKFVMQSLLLVQFSISIIMIGCMFAFRGQLNHLLNMDRGYTADNVVKLDLHFQSSNSQSSQNLVNILKANPDFTAISTYQGYGMTRYKGNDASVSVMFHGIDSSYLDLLGISVVQGTAFSPVYGSEQVLVNETFVKKAGILEPIGETLPMEINGHQSVTIVGVVNDYSFTNPRHETTSLLLYPSNKEDRYFNLLIKTGKNKMATAEALENAWKETFPHHSLSYNYLEEDYEKQLKEERKIAKIAGTGSIIAIFIAAFGLFGLVGITVKQKLKELSVRRVLGAGTTEVMKVLTRKFLFPVVLSLVIGLCISAYLSTEWLANYHNRMTYNWVFVAGPAVVILGVFLSTVGLQVGNVFRKNPAAYLKDE